MITTCPRIVEETKIDQKEARDHPFYIISTGAVPIHYYVHKGNVKRPFLGSDTSYRPHRVRRGNGRDLAHCRQLRVHEETSRSSLLRPDLRILHHVRGPERYHRCTHSGGKGAVL